MISTPQSKRTKLNVFRIIPGFIMFFTLVVPQVMWSIPHFEDAVTWAPHDQFNKSKVDSNEKRQPTVKWCIFVRSKFFGQHSPNRQATALNWFHDVTLPSIIASYSSWRSSSIRATSGVSLSVHYMLSVHGSYSNYSFPLYLVRSFAEHDIKLAVLPPAANVDLTEAYMIGAVKSTECSLVSAGRIDGDDILDLYFDEIVRGLLAFTYNRPETLDTAVLHGTKQTRKVYWSNFGCQYTQYNTTYAMSQGMTITLPKKGFFGSNIARIVYETSHTHVMKTIKEKVKLLKTSEVPRGGDWWVPSMEPHFLPMPLNTSVFSITILSSHWDDHKRIGRLKECSFLLEGNKNSSGGILRKEIFDVLNGAKAPTLTYSEMRENVFFPKNMTNSSYSPLL